MHIHIAYNFKPKQLTIKAVELQQLFGIEFDKGAHLLVDHLQLNLKPASIVLITGDSGSGKSSLLREISHNLQHELTPQNLLAVIDISKLNFDDRILIEQLNMPLQEGMSLLSQCGLSEARLMLRTPHELSDGQRYRFLLALAVSKKPAWIVADEFCANLDRTLAKVLSFNLQKLSYRKNIGFLLATTHDDLLADLDPLLHIECLLGQQPKLNYSSPDTPADNKPGLLSKPVKKKSPSTKTSGSPPVPSPIGRTSLGGITGAITLASPDSSPSFGITNTSS